MTPEQFIARWRDNELTERAGAQAHFDDLCELLGVEKPRDSDNYCFERGAKKASGGNGWADVWKRGHFGWENKKPKSDACSPSTCNAAHDAPDFAALHPYMDSSRFASIVCLWRRVRLHTYIRPVIAPACWP